MRLPTFLVLLIAGAASFAPTAVAAEADALAIDANIRAKHMPFGTILDPVYDSITGNTIVGYTRCGDSALWTGAYLAAESFRYKVTQSPDALDNVKYALAGIKFLVDVTGNNRLARCAFAADWQFAAGVESEEKGNGINQSAPWVWVGNTSRDEVVGVFFGLGVAYDMVDDAGVKSTIASLANRISHFIAGHQWSPSDDITISFLTRPEQGQMMIDTTRHVNPGDNISGPFAWPVPMTGSLSPTALESNNLGSYFKFNLDYMTFYNLVRYNPTNSDYLGTYVDVRNYTATHQNPYFDIIDHALRGANSFDAEIRPLLDQWLLRPKRDLYVDLSKDVQTCDSGGNEACKPIPVVMRPPTDFLWQRDPFMTKGGGFGTAEGAGIDYILPYWMGRFYNLIPAVVAQSAAAISYNLAPNSIASIYGINLASSTQNASSQPLPMQLGGATVTVTDSAGNQRQAGLIYASSTQINFVVPDGLANGNATITVTNGSTTTTATAPIQAVTPTLFSANSSGTGVAAATGVKVQAANPNLQAPVTVFQCGNSGCSSVPVALGVDTPIYLSFYATGIRNSTLAPPYSNVTLSINNKPMPIQYAGPAPGFAGLDQINVLLDLSLRGAGEVPVTLTVDGQTSNTVTVNIQ
jgi:uncharacterized protein (TIGR03437 family)